MAEPAEKREVLVGPDHLAGFLGVPSGAEGVVIFAHGSGSSRFSPRNNEVADALRRAGLATLLLDLLKPEEEADRANVFDIALLASRLERAARWAATAPDLTGLRIGFFGASTGAGAALVSAATLGSEIAAVVSRGGRPDLAGDALPEVEAATLLIVGGDDVNVIALNQEAYKRLRCVKDMVIVPGATHLFEEPGTLDTVILHARDWFLRFLSVPP
jgi:putative phosphoribosyl transferase